MRRSKYTAKLERERELRVIVLLPYIEEIALRRIVVPYPYICFCIKIISKDLVITFFMFTVF